MESNLRIYKHQWNTVYAFIFLLLVSACKHSPEVITSTSYVMEASYQSALLNDSINYRVYYPAGFEEMDSVNLLYLLHGHGGSDDDWITKEEGYVQSILDSLIGNDIIPPCVAVTYNAGNSWYVDSKLSMETFIKEEWIPYVNTGLIKDKGIQKKIIAGNSAGGFGTLRLSLLYPELFDASLLLSPAAYYPVPPAISSSRKIDVFSDENGFSETIWQSYSYVNIPLEKDKADSLPMLYLSTGDDDPYEIVHVVTQLRSYFLEHNIDHELTIIDGAHTWDVWRDRFAHDLVRALKD